MSSLLIFVFGVLGAMLASFAGVISERLNTGESWTRGRSRCNSCRRTLDWKDLMPVLSWSMARGKCRTCRANVPYRYVLSELVMAVLFASSYVSFGMSLALFLILPAFFLLAVIVLYDLRHTIVPFGPSIALILFSAAFAMETSATPQEFGRTLLIAGAIGSGFYLLHALSRGRAMGLGDAPVALALSLLADGNAFSGLLFSFWIGAVIGIGILVGRPRGHRMGIEVPFVPFLAAGYLLALFTQWHPFL